MIETPDIKAELIGGIQDLINLVENSREIDVGRNDRRSQVFEEIRDSLIDTNNLFLKFDYSPPKSKVFSLRINLDESTDDLDKKLSRLKQKVLRYRNSK